MIQLNLPTGARIIGGLYPSTDPRYLDDDMLRVDYRGFSIDVGWDPAYDADGDYLVTLYYRVWDDQLTHFSTPDVFAVKTFIEDTLEEIDSGTGAIVASGSDVHPPVTA